MKVLVCGGRAYTDASTIGTVLNDVHESRKIDILIEGGASGADKRAREWARSNGIHVATVDALWGGPLGKNAGPARNEAMLRLIPDLVVAFPGGTGTASMVRIASQAGVEVLQI